MVVKKKKVVVLLEKVQVNTVNEGWMDDGAAGGWEQGEARHLSASRNGQKCKCGQSTDHSHVHV